MSRKYRCPYCNKSYERDKLITHVNRVHSELIPEGFTASRVVFNHINKTTGSFCRICHEPTEWNEKAGRYNVLCGKQACKDAMRDEYKKNMLRVRGTYNILEDPEQQKLMLSHRKISGEYQFSDGGKIGYTGTYEKNCLEFMDVVMQIPSTDILSPGPTMEYTYEGKKHYYIPDFYYIPYNLIIEVKDGGDNPNNKSSVSMDNSREKTIEKERLITNKGEYNYIRLTNNNFQQLIAVFMDIKANLLENKGKPVIHINESSISESYIKEDNDYTKYISNFRNKSIDFNYKAYNINSKEAKSYIETNSYTKKYLNYLSENTGEILVDTDNNKLIGYIFVGKSKDKGFISTLEVVKDYRGYGFGNILIRDAINKYNAIDLVVYKDNKVALDMYKKLGFVIIGEDKNGKAWYMKLKSKLSKDDEIINEACKNIDSARSFVDDVKKLSKKYNANFFIVTDGASGYSNGNGGNNPAVKNARNKQIEWEKANGFDPYEDCGDRRKVEKFNEDLNKWDYGVLIGGTVYTDPKKIRWDMYRTIPLKDIEKLHVGVCWDFVNYQAEWFKRNGIDYRNYLIIVQKSSNPNDIDTHTFNIISIDDKLYWFESSWQSHQGIHPVKDYKTVLNVMLKDYKNWYNVSAYSYDTKGLANHLNGSQFIKRATKNCIYYKKNDDYQKDLTESTDVINELSRNDLNTIYIERGDRFYNLDKWNPYSNNILYITGVSGSGKTTMGEDIARNYKCGRVELDYVSRIYIAKDIDKRLKVYNMLKADCPEAAGFFKLYPIEKFKFNSFTETIDIVKKFCDWFIAKYSNNGKLYIINGAHIPNLYEPEYFKDKPIIIKEVNPLKTMVRRSSREIDKDKAFTDNLAAVYKAFIKGLPFIVNDNKDILLYKTKMNKIADLVESAESISEADKHYNYNSLASMDLYRITVDGIGIYEAFRRRVDFKIWKRFLDSPDVNWLDKPPLQYRSGMESYFTAIGYDRFIRDTLPYIKKFIRSKDIQVEHIFGLPNNKRLVYMDEYQVVVK